MMRKIISAILALTMCVSMMGGAAALVVDEDTGAVTYTFTTTALKDANGLTDVPGKNTTGLDWWSFSAAGSVANVVDYENHGWFYYGIGTNAQNAVDAESGFPFVYMLNLGTSNLKLRHTYTKSDTTYTVGDGKNLTALFSLDAPTEPGFYRLSAKVSAGGTKIYMSPKKSDYTNDNYFLSWCEAATTEKNDTSLYDYSSVIYSDGETDIILGFSVSSGTIEIYDVVLTPIDEPAGKALSFESAEIERGSNKRVITYVDSKVLVPAFITYRSNNESIATVNDFGRITAVGGGTTTVTVSVGDWSQDITVTVPEDPELKTAFAIDDTDDIEAAVYANKVSALAYVDGAESTEGVTATATQLSTGAYNMTTTTTNDEHTFLYWVKGLDGGAKKVVSREESFVYTPAGNGANYLIAVYEKDGATKDKAEFYDANGLLIKAIEGTTITTPDLPSMAGYGDAQKWVNKNGDKYADNTNVDISGTVMFIAEYAEPGADIIVTPLNNSCTVNKDKYAYGEKVICTPTATENFKAWVKNGEIVSVDAEKYEFYAWESCDVEAIYEAHTPLSGVARKILIDLFGNNIMAEYIGFGDAVEKGIILDNTEIAMTSTNRQFTIALDDAISAKGYAVVKNSDGTYTKYIDGSYTKSAE